MNEEGLYSELKNILDYWSDQVFDQKSGLFVGRIDNSGKVYPEAPLGSVLYARILWSFSAGYAFTKNIIYKERAVQAYRALKSHFFDAKNGGVYWSVLPDGTPLNKRKQIYAQAFGIYALAEFYKIEASEDVLNDAISLFELIERYSYDKEEGGYLDAFNQDWLPIEDMRLSEKDLNAAKTMNTHLHLLEAYSNLYSIHKSPILKRQINALLEIFLTKIIHPRKKHLQLFFNAQWRPLSSVQSYGHDIEASWLLMEAAERIDKKNIPEDLVEACNGLGLKSLEGLLEDCSLANEKEGEEINKERHWWVQSEALVGFYCMGLRTNSLPYVQIVESLWDYIQREIKDTNKGEWFWGRDENGNILQNQDKVGMWKCPYHNSRACLELLKYFSEPK